MKGKHLVIGVILFVVIVVGAIYLLMMAEINKQKDEIERSTIIEDSQTSHYKSLADHVSLRS